MRRADLALILTLAATSVAAGDLAYVTCQNGNALSVLDLDTGETRATWDVPGKPAGVAVASDGSVFTVSPDDATVRRYGPDGVVQADIVLDGGPIGIVLDAPRARLFVTDWYNARIWVLTTDLVPVTELTTGTAPAGLALSPDGRWLASADKDADQVSVFDADSLKLHRTVKVGSRPFGLRFGPEGRLFVGNVGSNDVTVLDPDSGMTLATVPVGTRPYGVAFAKGRAFVTNQYEDSVSVIALDTLQHLRKIAVGEYPEGIDTTSDGARLVVANWFENSVSVIDAQTLEVVDQIDTADGPRAFGVFIREDTE
ncbi:YVTN family beta-propeller protein [Sagittula marina]|uniref:YVTN family beta-propeller protein n=1 Tax=Sagittula marina TaxID=943940 RepID=A0A7W6GUF1_9RHOB|nr:YVTN family beta-propeller protein [Sagittula marina]